MMPWAGIMDFGVVHPLVYLACRLGDGPVVETLQEIVADATFGAVEIAPVNDPAVREQARALLATSQLQVVYLPILPNILSGLHLGQAEPAAREVVLARMRELIDEAILFDATLAMVGPPPDPGPGEREALVSRLVHDIQELCDYADARSRKRRLFLTLENFDRLVEKKRVIGPTSEAAALADAVQRENFGLTIDLSHLPLLNETPHEALGLAGRHLLHAHIGNCVVAYADSPLYGDFHPRFGHPQGANDLPQVTEYLNALNAVDYWEHARRRLGGLPILSMELRPSEGETSATILANGKRVFSRAWGMQSGREAD